MTENITATTTAPTAPAAPPELEQLASSVDAAHRAHAATVKQAGPASGPDAWLSPQEHARRVAVADDKLQSSLDELWADATMKAEARVAKATAERAAQDIEPWERLDTASLQRAAAMLPFVQAATSNATLREVADALGVRAAGKDPAAAVAWLTVAHGRVVEARAGASVDAPVPGLPQLEAAIRNAADVIDGPAVVAARAKAKAAEEAAREYRAGVDALRIQRDPRELRRLAGVYGVRYRAYEPKVR